MLVMYIVLQIHHRKADYVLHLQIEAYDIKILAIQADLIGRPSHAVFIDLLFDQDALINELVAQVGNRGKA